MAKILVVEDDPSLRTVIRLVLEQAGHDIAEAANGRVALQQMDSEAPELVVVDSKMPILSGAQLIEKIRAEPAHARLPVVMLTGLPGSVPEGSGADAIVAKPFEKSQFLDVIDRLLAPAGGTTA